MRPRADTEGQYNQPRAQQYACKSQSCMFISADTETCWSATTEHEYQEQ